MPKERGQLLVGDRLASSGASVLGFVVIQAHDSKRPKDVDDSTEFVLAEGEHHPRSFIPHDLLSVGSWEQTGTDPLSGAILHPVSREWRAQFDSAIGHPIHPWASYVGDILATCSRNRAWVFPVGGLVRDLLRGADPMDATQVNDMDIAGTLTPNAFREVLDGCLSDRAGGSTARLNWRPMLRTSGSQVVHMSRDEKSEPMIQYAGLKQAWINDRGTDRLLAGTSFQRDSSWRDVTYNGLFYDSLNGVIVDPSGSGLRDLGIEPAHLASRAPRDTVRGRMTVRVIDPPPSATPRVWVNTVARLVKQLRDFPEANFRPASEWFAKHRSRLERYVEEAALSEELRSKISELTVPGKTQLTSSLLSAKPLDEFGRWVTRTCGLSVRSGTWHDRPQPALAFTFNGTALAEVRDGEIQAPEGPDRPTPQSMARYFAGRVASYEHTAIELWWQGQAHRVLALRDRDEFGPTYVELDDNVPIETSEENLAKVLAANRLAT
jgi:hypothetical protein